MITKIKTITNIGLVGYEIIVEGDLNKAIPTIDIVGLPDATIKESKERIKATFRNLGISLPRQKIILNLAPSDLRKVGTRFDLPMAVAILQLSQKGNLQNLNILEKSIFLGELGLDGKLKRIKGILPSIISAINNGFDTFFVPRQNIHELQYLSKINLVPIDNFSEIVEFFINGEKINYYQTKEFSYTDSSIKSEIETNFKDIKGHQFAKHALTVAASGFHNLLMVGAPGTGKTMLSKALQSILPPMRFEEILETSQIYSVVGKFNKNNPIIIQRPHRMVHHTASKASIIGGGQQLTPGEVSLANKGILFFDEIPEFPREVLEVLRQPIEDKTINISRVSGTVQYPSDFMFVAAMNPCKCGFYKDQEKDCVCGDNEIRRYQGKISGPLLDRFDMILEIPRQNIDEVMSKTSGLSSEQLREKVYDSWKIQQKRFENSNITTNSQMSSKHIDKYIIMENEAEEFLKNFANKKFLSTRVVHRTIKLARTIADIGGNDKIQKTDIAQALQYRSKNMFVESSL